jgi:hypothetical protein
VNGSGGEWARPFMKFLEDDGTVHLDLADPKPLGSIVHKSNTIRAYLVELYPAPASPDKEPTVVREAGVGKLKFAASSVLRGGERREKNSSIE